MNCIHDNNNIDSNAQHNLSALAKVHPTWHEEVKHLSIRYAHSKAIIRWFADCCAKSLADPTAGIELKARIDSIKSLIIECNSLHEVAALYRIHFPALESLFLVSLGASSSTKTLRIRAPKLRRCRLKCSVAQYGASLRVLLVQFTLATTCIDKLTLAGITHATRPEHR